MNLQKYKLLGSLSAIAFGVAMIAPGIAVAQENESTAGAEVQTRGPVHEAFAGTVSFNPEVGIIVDQAPPELIEEVPPEQRLEGDNVSWIPGYWGWDEDQNDFLWISGIWRNLPPGREWVPGYWAETEGRHQWTSGYWEDSQTTEVTYLPKPPRSVEVGPNIEASSNDQSWVPGNWVYRDDRYAWRSGYWAPARQNWAWTPAYYRWTQRGYVYVDGYWDYPVVRRGVVFAPVRFDAGYRSRANFYYTPSTVVSLSVFTNHLFLRPNYGHYYYGDYYEPRYRDRGFFASYSYNSSRNGYDPIYSYNRWENRNDRNWDRQRQDYYEYRRDHADSRPPRSWASLSARSQVDRDRGDFGVAERYDRLVSTRDSGQRFQKVDQKDRERYDTQRKDIRKFGKEREQLETRKDKSDATGGKERETVTKQKVTRSPMMAKKSDRSNKDGGPPERLQPRASDKNQKIEKSDKAGNDLKTAGENPAKGKRSKDGTGDRESDPNSKGKSKMDTPAETRVKPGEKREKDPSAPGKEKRQADPKNERNAMPSEKRQGDPVADKKAKPSEKRQAEPNSEPKAKPAEKRQADPNPERQANPTPKRQAAPSSENKAKPAEKRKAAPTQERKANPTPKRGAEPQATRKVEKPQLRQPEPQRAVQKPAKQAQPQRQAEPRPQQQKAQPKEQAAPQQKRTQPTAPKAASSNPDKKKKKQAE